jgi:quinol monooxygenase YgiN
MTRHRGADVEPLHLIATIRPRPECREEALAALTELVARSRAEDGCEQYDLLADTADDGRLVMVERWATRAHWDAHMASAHVRVMGEREAELMAEPNALAFFSGVDVAAIA